MKRTEEPIQKPTTQEEAIKDYIDRDGPNYDIECVSDDQTPPELEE